MSNRIYVLSFDNDDTPPFSYSWWVKALEYVSEEFSVYDQLTEVRNAPELYWDEWERYKKLRVWILERIHRKENNWETK